MVTTVDDIRIITHEGLHEDGGRMYVYFKQDDDTIAINVNNIPRLITELTKIYDQLNKGE